MKLEIISGKFYLCEYDRVYGWYGYQITSEAYDALKDCDIENNEVDIELLREMSESVQQ
jgi:hypothetical protein